MSMAINDQIVLDSINKSEAVGLLTAKRYLTHSIRVELSDRSTDSSKVVIGNHQCSTQYYIQPSYLNPFSSK